MTFEASSAMGGSLRTTYQKLGYEIVDLPLLSPEDRVKFMIDNSPLSLIG